MPSDYALYFPPGVERQLKKLGATTQELITTRLNEIVRAANGPSFATATPPLGPPLRIYAGRYRIFYRVDQDTRRVVILELRTAFA